MKRKKVVLFYPKTDKENSNIQLPLSVLSIASDLINSGYSVEIIDERVEPNYKRYLPGKIKNSALFGISVMTGYQIKGGLEASRFAKDIDKKISVVWGGWHVSMLPEETLTNAYIDVGVIGPGEGILQQLYERIERNYDFFGIPNMVYKDYKGEISCSTQKNRINDTVSLITKEAVRLLGINRYIHSADFGSRSIFWVTSKGCPFDCGFCCSLKVYNRHWKGLEGARIVDDLEWLVKEYGINGVNFVDTNFFVDKERVYQMAKGIVERNLKIKWGASVRIDQVNLFVDEFLELLKESGCFKLFVGAESGSKEVLELIDKNINIEDTFKMTEILDKKGIIAEIYVMAGFPINPLKDLNETLGLVKAIKKLHPNHQFTSFLYTPYPGTPLYDLALKKGLRAPMRLEGWLNWNILEVKTPWITIRRYADRLHSFVKVYYPLAFPSERLKERFRDARSGWIYKLLHKLELFRVKNDFFIFTLEWPVFKLINSLRLKFKIFSNFGGFR